MTASDISTSLLSGEPDELSNLALDGGGVGSGERIGNWNVSKDGAVRDILAVLWLRGKRRGLMLEMRSRMYRE
jgi:hypothetical protein